MKIYLRFWNLKMISIWSSLLRYFNMMITTFNISKFSIEFQTLRRLKQMLDSIWIQLWRFWSSKHLTYWRKGHIVLGYGYRRTRRPAILDCSCFKINWFRSAWHNLLVANKQLHPCWSQQVSNPKWNCFHWIFELILRWTKCPNDIPNKTKP